ESADDARAYELVLPEVERVLTRTDEYEPLWRNAWQKIVAALESFARGASSVTEFPDAGISLVTLAPEIFSPSGFNPTRHAAPYTAISHYARGKLFLIAVPLQMGWAYRIDYPYYSWAETVVRPHIKHRDFSRVLNELNQLERGRGGLWRLDNSEMTSAVKFLGSDGTLTPSTVTPEKVAAMLAADLSISKTHVLNA
ncbi:MAG TPA: DUF6687 family protein, partial [Pyrinomonadaceae bacterium]|nr:DUF6687 family protein [Pyrinomonadaceae bacterium]